MLVDEVMVPALNNPMNQVGQSKVLINFVNSQIQEFRNNVAEVIFFCFTFYLLTIHTYIRKTLPSTQFCQFFYTEKKLWYKWYIQ